MRKGLVIFQVLAFLVLAGGASAYAYSVNSAVVNTPEPVGDIVTIALAASQPDWEQVMPYAVESGGMLWVIGSGDQTNISSQWPESGEHYDKVDEGTPDDMATYVYTDKKIYETDLYDLSELGIYDIEITDLTVSFRFSGGNDGTRDVTGYAAAVIKTGGRAYTGAQESQIGPAFVTRSYHWPNNPQTGTAWTIEELDELQAGAMIKTDDKDAPVRLTQVTVAVSYRETVISGNVPTGALFTVTPATGMNEYLQVSIYLTNTGNLNKAYDQLLLHLYLQNSVEASGEPGYEVLSLENGVASFNLPGGLVGGQTLRVVGGYYRLVSADITNWEDGWTVVPELYPEVSQR
ncbi:MAG: hypothetical protein WC369_09255 [Dehalococcoidales bacterium]|jgi:hypothetical protein